MQLKHIISSAVLPFFFKTSSALFIFTLYILIGQKTSPIVFGQFSFYMAFLNIVSIILLWGNNTLLIKFLATHNSISSHLSQIYSSLIILIINSLIFYLILSISENIFDFWLFKFKNSIFLLTVLSSFSYFLGYILNGLEKNTIFIFSTYFLPYFLMLLILTTISPNTINQIFIIHATALILSIILQYIILYNLYKIKKYTFSFFTSCQKIKQNYMQGYSFLLISLGAISLNWVDTIIIGIYENHIQVALYTSASRIVLITALVLVAINAVTTPLYAKLFYDGSIDELESTVHKISYLFLLVALFSTLFITIEGQFLLTLFGKTYIIMYPSLLILLIGQIVNLIAGPVGPLLSMTGHEKDLKKIIWEAFFINTFLSILLIQYLQINGVAIATSISLLFWNIKGVLTVKKRIGIWTIPYIQRLIK